MPNASVIQVKAAPASASLGLAGEDNGSTGSLPLLTGQMADQL